MSAARLAAPLVLVGIKTAIAIPCTQIKPRKFLHPSCMIAVELLQPPPVAPPSLQLPLLLDSQILLQHVFNVTIVVIIVVIKLLLSVLCMATHDSSDETCASTASRTNAHCSIEQQAQTSCWHPAKHDQMHIHHKVTNNCLPKIGASLTIEIWLLTQMLLQVKRSSTANDSPLTRRVALVVAHNVSAAEHSWEFGA